MNIFKKLAVASSVYAGLSYIAGIIIYLQFLQFNTVETPLEQLEIITTHPVLVHLTTFFTYVVFSAAIILLSTYIYQSLKTKESTLSLLSLISGVIWATLLIASGFIFMAFTTMIMGGVDTNGLDTVWQAIDIVSDALGGGNELVGGVFTGLLSMTMHRARWASKFTTVLGSIVCLGGVISALPYMADIGIGIFVISQIMWFFSLAWDIGKNK